MPSMQIVLISISLRYLYAGKSPDQSALILHNDVLPFTDSKALRSQSSLLISDEIIVDLQHAKITKNQYHGYKKNKDPLLANERFYGTF